jgi:hypothetical protein
MPLHVVGLALDNPAARRRHLLIAVNESGG